MVVKNLREEATQAPLEAAPRVCVEMKQRHRLSAHVTGPQAGLLRIIHAKRHGAATNPSMDPTSFVGHYSQFGVNELLEKWKGKMVWETLEAMQSAGQKMKRLL